jgi:GNAT superfamily N-acetyltransferase
MTEPRVTEGPGDVRALQSLVERIWTKESTYHIGDLAWERFHLPEREACGTTAVWREGDRVLGWAVIGADGELRLQVDPGWPGLGDEVVGWVVGRAGDRSLAATVSESEPLVMRALRQGGFMEQEHAPFFLHMARELRNLPPPPRHPGVVFRPSRGAADLERLLACHRAAWDGSRVTRESLFAVTEAWPYQDRWHWMAEDAEGHALSESICWWDAANRVGEFEPVGTHRDYRRQGLASAVMLHQLHQLKAEGARLAVVYARGDDLYPVPRQVYESLGFSVVTRTRTFVRTPA